MKKKVLWFLAVFVMVVAMSIGMKGETQAATYISTPKNVSVYNPELDTIYLKWSKVSGAKGYYVYISTEKYNGYKVINVGSKNSVVIKGSNGRTRYYFKVKAYDAVGVVSEDSKIVTRQGRIFGVDVSKHNGDIDWETLKPNIDYAIIRIGYGDNIVSQDDEKWYRNANECTRLGIPFGVYIYSYATSTAQASSEADHVLRLIKGYNLKFPVYYDMEDAPTTGTVPASVKGDMAQTFCDKIQNAGYKVGIYANTNWFNFYLTDARFNAWPKWVAQYNDVCKYGGVYKMWQFSSDGSVPGIATRVDMNYWYSGRQYNLSNKKNVDMNADGVYLGTPQNVETKALSGKKAEVTWSAVPGSTRYIVYRRKQGDKKYFRAAVTIGTRFEDSGLMNGQTYIYKVCAYTGIGGVEYFGQFSENKKVTTYAPQRANLDAAQLTKNSISLNWSAMNNAVSYKVYKYDAAAGKYMKIATTKTNSYVDLNVQPGVVYKYRLYATMRENNGVVYTILTATKAGIAGPGKVTGFSVDNSTPGSLRFNWVKAPGVSKYQIFYATSRNGKYKKLSDISPNKDYHNVSDLKKGKRYYFKMRSVRTYAGVTINSNSTSPITAKVK